MPIEIITKFIVLLVLLALSAFFSGSETAIFSLGKLDLDKLKESTKHKTLLDLIANPRDTLITILICNETTNALIALTSASIFYNLFSHKPWWFIIILSIVITTPLLLFVGEITPKSIAIKYSEKFALVSADPISILTKLFTPIRWVIDLFSQKIKPKKSSHKEKIKEEEFKSLIEVGTKEGVIDKDEKQLIHKVFEFGDLVASQAMTPKEKIFRVNITTPLAELVKQIEEYRFSRIPVYQDSPDNIIGILLAKDLIANFRWKKEKDEFNLYPLLKPPYFVPENKKIDTIFKNLKHKKMHLAIVVNEHSVISGIITMEDLLEELFGEIKDEYDIDEWLYDKIDENTFKVSTKMGIPQFSSLIGIKFSRTTAKTLGGLIFNHLERLPIEGEKIIINNIEFTIVNIKDEKIEQVFVKIITNNEQRTTNNDL